MQFGALGDIHGDFESVRRIMRRHPTIPFWLSVGDVADAGGGYEPVTAPLYWIKGNNENFDAIASRDLPENLHFIQNGVLVTVGPLRVAGLGGTLAPTWYDSPASALPRPAGGPPRGAARHARDAGPRAVRDDKRRHFVREEVEACKALRRIDLFLSHEAPRPFRIGRMDAGKTPVNEVLAAMAPRLHLFGHHHRFTEQAPQGIRSVGLDLVSKSYLLIESDTMGYHVLDLPDA